MTEEFEIVERGFYIPGVPDNPTVLFKNEQPSEYGQRLLDTNRLLQAVMHVEVTRECRDDLLRLTLEGPTFVDCLLKDWVESLGWSCLTFLGFIQSSRPTSEGKIRLYVAGRIFNPAAYAAHGL